VQAPPSVFQPLVSGTLDRLVRISAPQAWMVSLLLVDLAAIADVLTGTALWFGPIYLLVISITTWSLGWRAGHVTGISCMALTFTLNGTSLYPYTGSDLAWNLALRFTAVSLVVTVIAGARRAYLREWWLARIDILTGALNRQAFFELGETLSASSRWRLLLYADLDGLKAINDGRGHAAGDDCLKTFAATIRRAIRRNDLFARVGGDEFLVFMAVKDEAAAASTAARLHRTINAPPGGHGRTVRCSVGALLVPPGPMEIDELVRQADDLMYRAKQRGACLEIECAAQCGRPATAGRARAVPRALAPIAVSAAKPARERREPAGAVPQ
jgi:diguanylate cyclase (GGDEF)-like protein